MWPFLKKIKSYPKNLNCKYCGELNLIDEAHSFSFGDSELINEFRILQYEGGRDDEDIKICFHPPKKGRVDQVAWTSVIDSTVEYVLQSFDCLLDTCYERIYEMRSHAGEIESTRGKLSDRISLSLIRVYHDKRFDLLCCIACEEYRCEDVDICFDKNKNLLSFTGI